MKRNDLNDMAAFVAVAEAKSFTLAAASLGLSPSALSHAMQGLEERLGFRLLTRTTRSVATTDAGEQLLATLKPALAAISNEVTSLRGSPGKPAGTIRITAIKHAVTSVIVPMLPAFMARYPDIQVEVDVDNAFNDIVASRYDAGIRFAGSVAKDLIAVRISPEIRAAVVASPGYFASHPAPTSPQALVQHLCIAHRMTGVDGLYPWPFLINGKKSAVRITGSLVFNDSDLILQAALKGLGVAYLFEDEVAPYLRAGQLIQVLALCSVRFPGYDLYYSSRKQNTAALVALVNSLRLA